MYEVVLSCLYNNKTQECTTYHIFNLSSVQDFKSNAKQKQQYNLLQQVFNFHTSWNRHLDMRDSSVIASSKEQQICTRCSDRELINQCGGAGVRFGWRLNGTRRNDSLVETFTASNELKLSKT